MDLKNTPVNTYPKPVALAWVTAALIASSIEPLIVKIGFKGEATASQFLILKLIFGGLFIAPIYKSFVWVGKEKFKNLLLVSSLFILNYLFIFYSLTTITATILITIITTTPAVVAVINQIKAKEVAGSKFWFGFLICFIGVILTIDIFRTSGQSLDKVGVLLAFMSVVTSALYRTRMDSLTKSIKPITISAYIFLINGIVGLLLTPWLGEVKSGTWEIAVWIGFAGAIANIAFISALKLIGSTRLSVLTVLQRPLVIVLAAFILKEPLSYVQVTGILMVLIGIQMAKVVKREPNEDLSLKPSLLMK